MLATRRDWLRAAAGTIPLGSLAPGLLWPLAAPQALPAANVTTTALDGASVLSGAGCNVLAVPGSDGALVVDGGLAANANALLAAITQATGNERIATLINTHWHPEQTGLNESVGMAGGKILAQTKTAMYLGNTVYASALFAGRLPPLPEAARPNEVTRGEGAFEFDGLRVEFGYLPAAHTDGDLFVHLPALDLIAVGGVAAADRWPLLDYLNGAWYGGRVRALQRLADLAGPDTRVVPAHGPLLAGRDLVRQRDIYLALFETLIAYMNMGYGAEDAVADNPLAEYEDEFGDASAFLDGAYRSMLIAYVPD